MRFEPGLVGWQYAVSEDKERWAIDGLGTLRQRERVEYFLACCNMGLKLS
jgi:hypothetical protein